MKFVLIGAGKITERFLTEKRFQQLLKANMVGVIASRQIIDKIKAKPEFTSTAPFYCIGDKNQNEGELFDLIRAVKPDLLLSIQYPWILTRRILDSISGRVANLHNAKLPDYRGHNAISYEILNDEKTHTITLHWVVEEVDRGRIIKIKDIPIEVDDTAYSLWTRSVDSAVDLLDSWFAHLPHDLGFTEGEPVASGGHFYGKKISEQKQIPDGANVEIINRWARAFCFPPHEPAYFLYEQKKLYVIPNIWCYQNPSEN